MTAAPPRVTPRTEGDGVVEYTLRFPAPHTHYVEVEAIVPAPADPLELRMAVWTPGSYLVREFSRHIDEISAATVDGAPLAITKTAKNRWSITTKGVDRVVIRYRLYAREMSVRTNFVDDQMAVLNGAATFLEPVTGAAGYDVAVEPAPAWTHTVTALPAHPDGVAHRFFAADFDELVDSPIGVGNPALFEFEVEGVPHVLANFGEDDRWDGPRSARDVEAVVRTTVAMWGEIPYPRYVFLNVLNGGGGGLEHRASTLIQASPWATRKRDDYHRWLSLVAHELFHAWNVKRLRPEALGPFDYEREVYTRSLWIAEGITEYYDTLLLARAGIIDRDDYLAALSKMIGDLQETEGRTLQSLSDASFDAWIKYYRRDENTPNTEISYYTKGAVVAWLLDVEIRRATGGARSLDDLMRRAYQEFSGERGFSTAQFRALASEVAGRPLDTFFAHNVDGVVELDYAPALDWFGLELGDPDAGDDDDDEPAGWLGAKLDDRGVVTGVRAGSPAAAGGVNVDDELLAIDDYRVPPGGLDSRLERYRPGTSVSLLVARRGVLRRLVVVLGAVPAASWSLRELAGANLAQRAHLRAWLSP